MFNESFQSYHYLSFFLGGEAGEQSTTCQFSPSTMWVLGIKLGFPLGNTRLYLLSPLTRYLFMSLHKLNL